VYVCFFNIHISIFASFIQLLNFYIDTYSEKRRSRDDIYDGKYHRVSRGRKIFHREISRDEIISATLSFSFCLQTGNGMYSGMWIKVFGFMRCEITRDSRSQVSGIS